MAKAKAPKEVEAIKQNLVIQNDYQNVIDFGKSLLNSIVSVL